MAQGTGDPVPALGCRRLESDSKFRDDEDGATGQPMLRALPPASCRSVTQGKKWSSLLDGVKCSTSSPERR